VPQAPRRIVIAVIAVAVLVTASVVGRHLLGQSSASTASKASQGLAGIPTTTGAARQSASPAASGLANPSVLVPSSGAAGVAQAPASGAALPRVPTFPISPQIVRTATVDLRIGKDALSSALTNITGLAAADGGYVESSSMAGGTARSSPVSGSIVIHVLDADFSDAMTTLSGYGKVTNQQIQGKDVTDQVAANAATLQVLQSEVNLLQGKLTQATDINTFLQIQNQLFPAEQQLQQLQNQQAVLENSAALATITTNLSAPGAPLVTAPPPRPSANSATVAWRYLRHNSLAVLDGLAVGGGWALPVLALLALIWLAGTRVVRVRRRRHAVNPA
jgi:uncharacterized protein DUF4349